MAVESFKFNTMARREAVLCCAGDDDEEEEKNFKLSCEVCEEKEEEEEVDERKMKRWASLAVVRTDIHWRFEILFETKSKKKRSHPKTKQ